MRNSPGSGQSKDYRSVIITESSQESRENRKVIDDNYYSAKASVFNRLGSSSRSHVKISQNPTNEATANRIIHQSGYQSIHRKLCFSAPRSSINPRSWLHVTHGIRIHWARWRTNKNARQQILQRVTPAVVDHPQWYKPPTNPLQLRSLG